MNFVALTGDENNEIDMDIYKKFHWLISQFNQHCLEIENLNISIGNDHTSNRKEIKIFSLNIILNLLAFDDRVRGLDNLELIKVILTSIVISLKFICDGLDLNYSDISGYYRFRYSITANELVGIEAHILDFLEWDLKCIYTPVRYNEQELTEIVNLLNPLNVEWIVKVYRRCIADAYRQRPTT